MSRSASGTEVADVATGSVELMTRGAPTPTDVADDTGPADDSPLTEDAAGPTPVMVSAVRNIH